MMHEAKPFTCSCGVQAFRDIRFPRPGIMNVTCFHCGMEHSVSLSAIAAELAWECMGREAPAPTPSEATLLKHHRGMMDTLDDEPLPGSEPVSSGYKYGGLL